MLRTCLLLFGLLLAGLSPARAASWYRHANCTSPCSESDHTCVNTASCSTAWDACPPGTLQVRNYTAVDHDDCRQTGCTPGGCEEGWAETAKEACFDVQSCLAHAGVCFRETCCRRRPQLSCCELLACDVEYAACEVPQQRYLNDSSRSQLDHTRVAHTGSAVFPFYDQPHVPPGGSCEAVRRWGRCGCLDGANVPGCDPFNSSTWADAGAEAGEDGVAPRLPANLSLICVALLPAGPPLAPPAAPATDGGGSRSASVVPPTATPPDAPISGRPAGGRGQSSGGGGGGRPRASHGGLVALIVLGCLALGGGCMVLVVWCAGMMPDLHGLRIRSMTTYEPVFTGQSYTPGLGHPGAAPGDIPWNRFCAALGEAARRLRYGRRYAAERAAAAAAEERFRMLRYAPGSPLTLPLAARSPGPSGPGGGSGYVSLGLRASGSGGGGGEGAGARDVGRQWGDGAPGGGGAGGGVRDADDVFTLEDLGAAGYTGGGRHAGYGGRGGRPGGGGAHHGAGPGTATELELGHVGRAPDPAGPIRPTGPGRARVNQFGGGSEGGGGGGRVAGGGGAGAHEVIHTRALPLSDSDGGGGDDEDDEGLDAPLRLLPTPQTTGRDAGGPRRGTPL